MARESENPLFAASQGAPKGGGGAAAREGLRGGPGTQFPGREPLASRMRPRTLDEFTGQEHIVGPGRLLRRAIQKDQLSSIILSGPPGTGKTTLARIIANTTRSDFIALNAVLSGVAELRESIERARRHYELYSLRTILFVDEVHRWNKSQQDALLPWVENGTVVLIGATTENPFFEVNRALVSRSRVFLLRTLTDEDLARIAQMTLGDKERGYGDYSVEFEEGALEHLIHTADGDARSLLNALELAIETSVDRWPPEAGTSIKVSLETSEESIQKRVVLYDKDGDYHYDAISAFIKSLRGSDPDAALYWLARMVYAGEDPSFIFRRMFISAAEDIGLADPNALQVVSSCAQAFDRIGMPEGQYHLSLAALYLSTCPKSNSTMGYFDALKAVEEEGAEVPDHLKDANRDSVGFGHGEGYKYPHAYKDHWVAQQYLPESLKRSVFYFPGSTGFEGTRRTDVLERREAQLSLIEEDVEEGRAQAKPGLSVWSKEGERRKKWVSRAEGAASLRLRLARAFLFDAIGCGRSETILVLDPRKGFYALEAARRAPEGTVAVLVENEEARTQLERLTADIPELLRPMAVTPALSAPSSRWLEEGFGFAAFDRILVCEPLGRHDPVLDYWAYVEAALAASAPPLAGSTAALAASGIVFFDILGGRSSYLSEMLRLNVTDPDLKIKELIDALEAFEKKRGGGPSLAAETIRQDEEKAGKIFSSHLKKAGISKKPAIRVERLTYDRYLTAAEIETWLSAESDYGAALRADLGAEALASLKELLGKKIGTVRWPLFLSLATV
ncbi:MAG TPA: AAA family ATPase [Rectinemataceae bacterium]|nr:AAA family ATPase [Rectinemataceae bacterium]